MYNLVSTFVRSYDRTVGVRELDASNINIRELISHNAEVFLILTNTHLTGEMTLDLSTVTDLIYKKAPSLTVSQWLVEIGNLTLQTSPGRLKITERKSFCVSAFESGYEVSSSTGYTGSDNDSAPYELREHVVLKKRDIDYVAMRKYTLAAVNGYLHLTDSDTTGYYILDAAKSMRVGGSPSVNLLSLANIGELKCIPLSQCSITPRDQVNLFRGVTITTSEQLTDKTVWLSVAGHLMMLGRSYSVSGEHSVYLDWRALDIKRKYMVAKQFLDLSAVDSVLGIEEESEGIVSRLSMNSDALIRAILNLSQSFLIVIDNPTVSIDIERVEDASPLGKYFVYNDPYRLYMTGDGRLPPTSLINERKAWVVSTSVEQGTSPVYLADDLSDEMMGLYTRHEDPSRPRRRTALYAVSVKTTQLELA